MIDLNDPEQRIRKSDRVIHLKQMEGEQAKNSKGLVDNRLFQGGNKLHAVRNPEHGLWTLRYEAGLVPEPLQQSFTSFDKLLGFVKGYFERRGIEVERVED